VNCLRVLFKIILISLLVICPFIPMLSSKLSFLINPLSIIISGYKEIVQLCLFLLLILIFSIFKRLKFKSFPSFVLLIFSFYSAFHFFGYMPANLIFDGYRYQVGYILIFTLLCMLPIEHSKFGIDVQLLSKIIIFQFVIVATIGVIEFFYPDIIYILYGVNKSDMAHVTMAGGFRLISVFVNPINFGIFLCVSFSAIYYFALSKNTKFYWLLFWFLWMVCLFLIFFTLSRLALITFLVQTLIVVIANLRRLEVVSTFFVCVFSLFVIPSLFVFLNDFEHLLSRVENLVNSDTYTSNSRVSNWVTAISYLDNIFYFLWGLGVGASNPNIDSVGFMIENSYVSIFIELGAIGLVLFLIISSVVFYRLLFALNVSMETLGFLILFFISFYFMSLGNDLNRNFPFNFYFWYCVCYVFSVIKVKRFDFGKTNKVYN
jgi:hypothetical protein